MPSYRTASRAAVVDEPITDLDRSVVGAFLARVGAAVAHLALRLWCRLSRRPWDSLGIATATVASVAILVNAVFLQASPHPAPMLPGKPRPVALAEATGTVVAEKPRPAGERVAIATDAPATARTRAQIVADIQRELARRGFFDGPLDGVHGAKTDAAIRDFEQAAGLKTNSQPDEALLRAIMRSAIHAPSRAPAVAPRAPAAGNAAAAKPASPSRRVLAVQRALAEFGYGQVRPNGVLGAETKTAIERFERERKLPVTGQISDRLTRELAAVTGRPLE